MSGLLFTILVLYVLAAGVIAHRVVRPAVADWYHSKTYWIGGSDGGNVVLKLLGSKLHFEIFTFLASCIFGALGGWIYAMRRNRISI